MAVQNFEQIVEKAKQTGKRSRVVIAGADAENILLGAFQGFTYENIRLTFENGRITKAEANDTERINQVFDTDEGARYVGEFAIGVNPYVLYPMKDTLFDEKIMGSIHFTPGNCYAEAPNGNTSSIHWDLVLIQRPEYGGGEIWFDDVLIRKDGVFVLPELGVLNPEELVKK